MREAAVKRHWIEYRDERPASPLTFWVHRAVGDAPWYESQEFEPPRQPVVPGRGYPLFKVECDGFTFEFASLCEIRACIETLAKKVLPRTIDLSRERGTAKGPNSHWLSRLPANVKSWKYREKAVVCLGEALAEFEKAVR
jgi:hypothetical protein